MNADTPIGHTMSSTPTYRNVKMQVGVYMDIFGRKRFRPYMDKLQSFFRDNAVEEPEAEGELIRSRSVEALLEETPAWQAAAAPVAVPPVQEPL